MKKMQDEIGSNIGSYFISFFSFAVFGVEYYRITDSLLQIANARNAIIEDPGLDFLLDISISDSLCILFSISMLENAHLLRLPKQLLKRSASRDTSTLLVQAKRP